MKERTGRTYNGLRNEAWREREALSYDGAGKSRAPTRYFKVLGAFGLMVLWDWLSTVGTRYIAERSLLAVPFAGTVAILWWMAIAFSRDKMMCAAVILGAMAGTGLGILWP